MPFAVPPAITTRKPLSCERVKVNWEHPLNRSLQHWWLLNENVGTTLYDLAKGAQVNGSLVNGPKWNGEYVRTLNSDSSYLLFPVSRSETSTTGTSYTISLLIRPSIYPTGQGVFQWASGVNSGSPLLLFQHDDYSRIRFYWGEGWQIGDQVIDESKWTVVHFTMLGPTGRGTYYKDGVQIAQATAAMTTVSATAMYIGSGYSSYDSIDAAWLRLYDRELSPVEVLDDYLHPYGTPDNPRLI